MVKGTKATKERKRRTVAAGVALGASAHAIAKAAGCSKRHVETLAAEPETQLLVTEALRPHRDALKKLIPKALRVIERGLTARIQVSGADHRTQLLAARRLENYLKLAEGNPLETSGGRGRTGMVTWHEFTLMYQERMGHEESDASH